MSSALKDKTNKKSDLKHKNFFTEKDSILEFLRHKFTETKDPNLAYDIERCIELIEGKENSEVTELKKYYTELAIERDLLFRKNCELQCEIDRMNEGEEKYIIEEESE